MHREYSPVHLIYFHISAVHCTGSDHVSDHILLHDPSDILRHYTSTSMIIGMTIGLLFVFFQM